MGEVGARLSCLCRSKSRVVWCGRIQTDLYVYTYTCVYICNDLPLFHSPGKCAHRYHALIQLHFHIHCIPLSVSSGDHFRTR